MKIPKWNIAFAILWIIIGLILCLILIGIIPLVYGIKSLKWNLKYVKNPSDNEARWKAIVYGSFFGLPWVGGHIKNPNNLNKKAWWMLICVLLFFLYVTIIIAIVITILYYMELYTMKKDILEGQY